MDLPEISELDLEDAALGILVFNGIAVTFQEITGIRFVMDGLGYLGAVSMAVLAALYFKDGKLEIINR
jgi:hypothetical protein